jgi:hypothetical protein
MVIDDRSQETNCEVTICYAGINDLNNGIVAGFRDGRIT